jgi:hypothetical protein
MGFAVYNSKQVQCLVGGVDIDGDRGEEDFCAIEKLEEDVVVHSSSDGGGAVSVTNDEWHKVTLTLMHTSKGNAILSGMRAAGKLLPQKVLVLPLIVIDSGSNGNLLASDKAVIAKMADETYSKEIKEVDWVFYVYDPLRFIGGH